MTKRIYNTIPDAPDTRDYIYQATPVKIAAAVDMRPKMPPVADQGQLGSCAENAYAAGMLEYLRSQAGLPFVEMSRLDLYYKVREIEGSIDTDAGSMLRDVFKVGQDRGVAPEADYPYIIENFRNAPSAQAEADAASYKIYEYHRITTYADMKAALSNGQPVQIGFAVYDSFESVETANGGVVATPDPTKENLLGGHSILLAGYNPPEHPGEYIIGRNSWSHFWGDHGYCYIPKSYWDLGLVIDMWTATLVKPLVKPEDLSFHQAIMQLVKEHIFIDPVFWDAFEAAVKTGTVTQAQAAVVLLAFKKIAANDINQGK